MSYPVVQYHAGCHVSRCRSTILTAGLRTEEMMRKYSFKMTAAGAIGLLLVLFMGPSWADTDKPVVVGSTNFIEQLVLANIYADVLEAHGIQVKKRFNLGSREVVFPALESGELDVLPEYTGMLLSYLTDGQAKEVGSDEVLTALRKHLPDDIVALQISEAEDKDGLAVTEETAEKYDLKTYSDLKPVAQKLTLGGPPEMKTRSVGLDGLKKVYDVEFKTFRSLDAGGPLTQAALSSGQIDVARIFTTQGVLEQRDWVVLEDDKNLVPAENLVPIVRKSVATEKVRKLLDKISENLTTDELRKMNKRVGVDHDDPEAVASEWVKKHNLDK